MDSGERWERVKSSKRSAMWAEGRWRGVREESRD
jgi:hypothetical protein